MILKFIKLWRIGRARNNSGPIVATFLNCETKKLIFINRTKFKGSNIYVDHDKL